MNNNYDCIIVGAGVSGCTLSYILAKAGYNILLLESARLEDVGHNWWDAVEEQIFSNFKYPQLLPTPDELFKKTPITFYTSKLKRIGTFEPADLNLHRKKYSQRIINLLGKIGVNIKDCMKVVHPIIKDNFVKGVIAKSLRDNSTLNVSSNIVVDASGLNAVIRKQVNESSYWNDSISDGDIMIAYREIRNKIKYDEHEFKTYFGYKGGIFWENYSQDDLIDFFGGIPLKKDNKNMNPKDLVKNLINQNQSVGNKIVMGGYSAKLPIRRCLDTFVDNGVIIIGDAAFQTNPINGCGVASCINAALIASEIIIKSLQEIDFSKKQLWEYNVKYVRNRGAKFAALDIIKKFLMNLTEYQLHFLLNKRILKISDIKSGYDFKPIKIEIFDLLGRMIRGISKFDILLKLNSIIDVCNKVYDIYKKYPTTYNEEFEKWRQRVNQYFKKMV
ncbi:MAG: NAD(P)/FAD-dependent oxidoreductase [Candidatus Helarchaeota archaeon]